MRIAEIAPPWVKVPPERYGGIEWIVSLLTDGLIDRGHDVTLYASGDSTTRARLRAPLDAPAGFGNGPWYEAVNALTAHTVPAFLEADRYDIIHDHSGAVGACLELENMTQKGTDNATQEKMTHRDDARCPGRLLRSILHQAVSEDGTARLSRSASFAVDGRLRRSSKVGVPYRGRPASPPMSSPFPPGGTPVRPGGFGLEKGRGVESAKDERRRREGYDELDRIFEGTEKSLGSGNRHEADESLRRAGVKAVTMWAGLDRPPPAHIWLLIRLIWQLQTDINRPGQNSLQMLRTNLRELRYRFDLEARRGKSGRVLLSKGWAEIGYSGLTRSVWLIAKNENGSGELLREPLTIGDDEDKALPVFGFREEAEMFLRLCGMGRDWRVQESAPAELVSMLYGPCANVNEVALDPLPEMVAERTIGFVSLAREHFVERFMVPRRLLGIREPVRESPQQRDTPRYGATPEDDERNPVRLLSEGGRRPLSRGGLREVRPRKSS